MMTADERDRLRALSERPWALVPERAVPLHLYCDRCGAEFTTHALAPECPHCTEIGGIQ
jgi:hypothetical protein